METYLFMVKKGLQMPKFSKYIDPSVIEPCLRHGKCKYYEKCEEEELSCYMFYQYVTSKYEEDIECRNVRHTIYFLV